MFQFDDITCLRMEPRNFLEVMNVVLHLLGNIETQKKTKNVPVKHNESTLLFSLPTIQTSSSCEIPLMMAKSAYD